MTKLCVIALTSLLACPALSFAQGGRGATEVPIDRIVAVVGPKVITQTELIAAYLDEIAMRQQRKMPPLPSDSAGLRQVLGDMVDMELLLQKGQAMKLSIPDDEVTPNVERMMSEARKGFRDDREFLDAIREKGLSSIADLRKLYMDQTRNQLLQKKTLDTLEKLGKMPKVPVSEKEIKAAYDSAVARTPAAGPRVSFRQIVINPQPSKAADSAAKKLADSLYAAIKAGANFDSLARRFSADSGSAANGGDVGWFRRDSMVAEFSAAAFSTRVNELAPVTKTRYGYHVIRVDRVRPGEVRASHILIAPHRDSTDVARARAQADSVADAIRKGASYDTLALKYHDPAEERLLNDYPSDMLPDNYKAAITPLKPREISPAFEIPTATWPKIAIVQLMSRNESGIPTLAEKREELRSMLQEAASRRHLLDTLKRENYVSISLDQPPARAGQ